MSVVKKCEFGLPEVVTDHQPEPELRVVPSAPKTGLSETVLSRPSGYETP